MEKSENLDVLLIFMPFGISFIPSLGLSLLKESVKKKGFSAIIKYYTLKFTQFIGEMEYIAVSEGAANELLGEWIFTGTLFNSLPPDSKYLKDILNDTAEALFNNERMRNKRAWQRISAEDSINRLLEIKSKAEAFIDSCLEEIISIKPKIVGFSTSFQQNIASLALAKRIKDHCPETVIIFGGANCEGAMGMEIVKKFPFVDIVVSGEADNLLPELVSKIIDKEDYKHLPGVICHSNLQLHANGVVNSPMITDMDSLPIPDYDDYFAQFKEYGIKELPSFIISFESSRGCWWGEKSHCTFCGLNGNSMLHRTKSATRLLDELKFLKNKYNSISFSATDNILDMSYFKDFLPALASENLNLKIFYEVKSNLNREQVRLLSAAKVNHIQPGIESFNTHVLDLMKKGVKSIQNIQLLKWCKEYGIKVTWNIIWGFPGETKEDYYEMASLIPKISHLEPPYGVTPLSIHRFSPNFNYPERFGIRDVTPCPAYSYIYPFDKESIFNLAYQFDYKYDKEDNFDYALDSTIRELSKWKINSLDSGLFFIDQEDALVVFDLRPDAGKPYYILYANERFIYLFCDRAQPIAKIISDYSKNFNREPNETEVNELLDSMINKNLMIRENNSYLSLAIELRNYSPNIEVMKKLVTTLKNRPAGDNQVTITDKNGLLIELSC